MIFNQFHAHEHTYEYVVWQNKYVMNTPKKNVLHAKR